MEHHWFWRSALKLHDRVAVGKVRTHAAFDAWLARHISNVSRFIDVMIGVELDLPKGFTRLKFRRCLNDLSPMVSVRKNNLDGLLREVLEQRNPTKLFVLIKIQATELEKEGGGWPDLGQKTALASLKTIKYGIKQPGFELRFG